MIDPRAETEAVVRHPRVIGLGRDREEQDRVDRFAHDLAAWMAGAPHASLRPLARVVTLVGGPTLRDTRTLCMGLPLLAVEAAARATESLWPLLRDAWRDPPPPPPEEEEGGDDEDGADEAAAGGGASDAGGEGSDGADAQGEATSPGVADTLGDATEDAQTGDLGALAGEEDEEVGALEAALERRRGALGAGPADQLAGAAAAAGAAAWTGAREGEEVARAVSQLLPGVGWGMAPGQLQRGLLRRLEPWTALVAALPALRALADRLGRLEADGRRRARREGGSEEVAGVHLGGDVARALPAELGLLGDAELEDLFFQRHAERRLVSLELRGAGLDGVADPARRGPVIAAVDTSGSMRGAPGVLAKAAVLAVARRLLPAGRAVHVLLFGGAGEQRELRLRRGAGGLEDLVDLLAWEFGGGTDFDTPLLRALELLDERGLEAADVLVVTDGLARASGQVETAVQRARQRAGVRCLSLVLGGDDAEVRRFSDEVWRFELDAGVLGLTRALTSGVRGGAQ